MDTYSLIIKASARRDAVRHCEAHGLTPFCTDMTAHGEVIAYTRSNLARLQSWYNEASDPPFPAGTLLLFSEV